MSLCPCGSGAELAACCGPYIDGSKLAPTAEALMRARFSAHHEKAYEFLHNSVHPEFREDSSPDQIKEWSSLMDWEKLEVLATSAGGPEDTSGQVDFVAHYSVKGYPQELKEDAFFRKEGDIWYYVEGNVYGGTPVRREGPKLGRNDPCHCGSGKKYKKCCMA